MRFDEHTQDSGNVSFGVRLGQERYFVKTAGNPESNEPYLSHAERVRLLENAVNLSQSCQHAMLPPVLHMIQSAWGPMLVYAWVEGELLHASLQQREDGQSAFQRFCRLPVEEICTVLDGIYDLHSQLAQNGWIAVDFYDGCLIYNFEQHQMHLVDLDMYHQGPFTNKMGRMFGSSRFMAPEEFQLHAVIDQRTTVFALGRAALILLSNGTWERSFFRGSHLLYAVIQQACAQAPEKRFQSVAECYAAWQAGRGR